MSQSLTVGGEPGDRQTWEGWLALGGTASGKLATAPHVMTPPTRWPGTDRELQGTWAAQLGQVQSPEPEWVESPEAAGEGQVSPAQVRSRARFLLFSWTWMGRRPQCGHAGGPPCLLIENVVAGWGPIPRGCGGYVRSWTRLEQLPVRRCERVTGHRICPHCSEVRTYHIQSCTVFILKSPLNASEMDTLQKILNSVQSGYLNKPDGAAAVL